MSKSISAGLLAAIQRGVTTLVTCIVITRKDGKSFRLTSHDADLVVGGETYRHDIPFALSAIDSSSAMSVDNTELSVKCDGTLFTRDAFEVGLFDYAEVEVFDIDYQNIAAGTMTLRRGWFGRIEKNRKDVIKITITGLTKVLDFEVGRIYQPGCDADLGDTRCKVAIDFSQAYSSYNPYKTGDWVRYWDPDSVIELTLTNPSFETDGARTEAQAITGWTKTTGSGWFVATSATSPTYGSTGTLAPGDGTYALYASRDATADDSGFENCVYQDLDITSTLINTTHLDDGRIMMGVTAMLANTLGTSDPVRLRVELLDTDGEYVGSFDTRWIFLDAHQSWRERSLVFPVYPTTRTVRIMLYARKEDGNTANVAFDNVRAFYFDHTISTAAYDVIHRAVRFVSWTDTAPAKPLNNGNFEAQTSGVNNANGASITSWTTGAGNWWQVKSTIGSGNALNASEGSFFLGGGDDGSATEKSYTATQDYFLTNAGLDAARRALGKYVCNFSLKVGFAGPGTSKATVKVELIDVSSTILETHYVMNDANNAGVTGSWQDRSVSFTLPAAAVKMKVTLIAHSPSGQSFAGVGFDRCRFYFYDAERPATEDSTSEVGDTETIWSTTVGGFTVDSSIVWKAMAVYNGFDVVSTVTDRKSFAATAMSGSEGAYETGMIWWLSGANAGLRNIIRTWDTDTKAVKLYFKEPYEIQVGDRYVYVRSCQRRFLEDCQVVFQNQLNFRGFPHVPGKLRQAEAGEG